MKIVYFGSDVFLSCFEFFLENHEILALYTYHNNEDYFNEYAIKKSAEKNGIPVYYGLPSEERISEYFDKEGCGLFFVAEYNQIIPIPNGCKKFRGLNVHSSLLPQGRSYYPIEAAMERGLSESGVTVHKISPELDHGDIVMQRKIALTPEKDSVDIYLECAAKAREMTEKIFDDLDGALGRAKPQTEKLPYWKRPSDELLTVGHEMTVKEALEVFRKFNGMTQVKLGEKMYYIGGMSGGTAPIGADERFISDDRLLYRAADGHLRLHIIPTEVSE